MVSEINNQNALKSIDQSDYLKTFKSLLQKKMGTSPTSTNRAAKASLYRFLISKGYESELIGQHINLNLNDNES